MEEKLLTWMKLMCVLSEGLDRLPEHPERVLEIALDDHAQRLPLIHYVSGHSAAVEAAVSVFATSRQWPLLLSEDEEICLRWRLEGAIDATNALRLADLKLGRSIEGQDEAGLIEWLLTAYWNEESYGQIECRICDLADGFAAGNADRQ